MIWLDCGPPTAKVNLTSSPSNNNDDHKHNCALYIGRVCVFCWFVLFYLVYVFVIVGVCVCTCCSFPLVFHALCSVSPGGHYDFC